MSVFTYVKRSFSMPTMQITPMIILHTSHINVENIVAGQGLGIAVGDRNKLFDAFTGFEFNEI